MSYYVKRFISGRPCKFNIALRPLERQTGLLGTGSPGRPPPQLFMYTARNFRNGLVNLSCILQAQVMLQDVNRFTANQSVY